LPTLFNVFTKRRRQIEALSLANEMLRGRLQAKESELRQVSTRAAELCAAWQESRDSCSDKETVLERLRATEDELHRVWQHAAALDAALQESQQYLRSAVYHHDHLAVWHKNVAFLQNPLFQRAYAAGMDSGHKMGRARGSTQDIHIEWRTHVICWAAWHAKHLPGSFVECGVNTGIYSLAACHYIDFNATGKDFYLFDTFNGIPCEQMAEQERADRTQRNASHYEECYELVCRNFALFPRARLVRGMIPATLAQVAIDQVCYLSIDMNIVAPEIAALEFFWDKLVPGAPVILDDYGWQVHAAQQRAMDSFAQGQGLSILSLPTGQGLLIKPPELPA
jgi:O-methyltransferase